LFIIYRFRFAFIAPGVLPLDSFHLQKIVIAKIQGEHT